MFRWVDNKVCSTFSANGQISFSIINQGEQVRLFCIVRYLYYYILCMFVDIHIIRLFQYCTSPFCLFQYPSRFILNSAHAMLNCFRRRVCLLSSSSPTLQTVLGIQCVNTLLQSGRHLKLSECWFHWMRSKSVLFSFIQPVCLGSTLSQQVNVTSAIVPACGKSVLKDPNSVLKDPNHSVTMSDGFEVINNPI